QVSRERRRLSQGRRRGHERRAVALENEELSVRLDETEPRREKRGQRLEPQTRARGNENLDAAFFRVAAHEIRLRAHDQRLARSSLSQEFLVLFLHSE